LAPQWKDVWLNLEACALARAGWVSQLNHHTSQSLRNTSIHPCLPHFVS
jgi:hypothetical protein